MLPENVGKWSEHPEIVRHATSGWKTTQQEICIKEKSFEEEECTVTKKTSQKAWACLPAKIYEIDPFLCPECGSEMRMIAVIQDVSETF